ncbi:MAG TPA: hypothetical protein DCF33_21405 [Saprospirales bacterium]|nr:hypothetical protein [Saprospirales bacterium]
MKLIVTLYCIFQLISCNICAQADIKYQSAYYDSITTHGPESMHSQGGITNQEFYYYRFNPDELEFAKVVTAWRDSIPVMEHAYLNPFHCIGTTFIHDSIYLSLRETTPNLIFERIDLDLAILDTSITIGFDYQGTISVIEFGIMSDTMTTRGYFDNGNLQYKGQYKNAKKEGEWIYYYVSGLIEHIENWNQGQLNGEFISFYQNGSMYSKENYQNHKRHGSVIFYSRNGEITKREKYIDGVQVE